MLGVVAGLDAVGPFRVDLAAVAGVGLKRCINQRGLRRRQVMVDQQRRGSGHLIGEMAGVMRCVCTVLPCYSATHRRIRSARSDGFAQSLNDHPVPRFASTSPYPESCPTMSADAKATNLSPFTPDYHASGVLLHVTSLPSPYGIGDLGPAAFGWIYRLYEAGQTWWQELHGRSLAVHCFALIPRFGRPDRNLFLHRMR